MRANEARDRGGVVRRRPDVIKKFLADLEESAILPAEHFYLAEKAAKDGKNTPEELTEWLVSQGWLTRWQANHLSNGEVHFYLGDYLLLDHIATGGMGAVYKARKWDSTQLVAMKLLSQQSTSDPIQLARFRREISLLSKLDHKTIVKAYHAETAGELVYLVMEYVPGDDLWEWLRQYESLPLDFSCECIRQACIGLEYAASLGIVHRDFKPANLIVCWPNEGGPPLCKILDLGLARLREATDAIKPLTASGQFVGTPDYVSPEQCHDARKVDVRSDIYSLGITLFEMLTGHLPFQASTPLEAILLKENTPPPLLRSRMPSAPAELEAVIGKMIAANPDDRFTTPGETAAALEPFCDYMRNPDI
jgi:serine/threonine protein kinase